MQLLQRWASCHGSFARAIAAAAMLAFLATSLTASPVFRKQPAAVYPVTAFPGGCCSEKKNVLVVFSVGSRRRRRRSISSSIASSSDNTPAAGLISSINNEQIGEALCSGHQPTLSIHLATYAGTKDFSPAKILAPTKSSDDNDDDGESSDEEMVLVKAVPVKNGKPTADETSEEESELEEEPKPVAKAIKAPAKKDESSSEEDEEDSDDEEVVPVKSAPAKAAQPTPTSVDSDEDEEDDSDEDESDDEKPVKNGVKPAAKPEDSGDDDDDDDSEEESKEGAENGKVKAKTVDDDEDEEDEYEKKVEAKTPVKSNVSGGGGKKLFVRNLSFKATEDTLYEFFKVAGPVSDVYIAQDDNGSRGFGFVRMDTEGVAKALELNGQYLEGREVHCEVAREREDRTQSAGKNWKSPGGENTGLQIQRQELTRLFLLGVLTSSKRKTQ